MKTLLRTSAMIAALVMAVPMLAQKSFAPSPSITSGTYTGYPSASILTPNNLRLGDSAPHIRNTGPYGTGAFAGHPVVPQGQKAFMPQRNHHRGNNYLYPGYPAYYYSPYAYGYGYPDPVVIEDSSSLPGAGTFNTNGPQYTPVYRPSAGSESVTEEQGGRFYERTVTERSSEPLPESTNVPASTPAPTVAANGNEESDVRTLLIFKDGHRLEIANYAIMGTTVYVFSGDRRKIPLTELNLDETVKANEDRGTDFHVPVAPNPS